MHGRSCLGVHEWSSGLKGGLFARGLQAPCASILVLLERRTKYRTITNDNLDVRPLSPRGGSRQYADPAHSYYATIDPPFTLCSDLAHRSEDLL